MSIFSGDDPPAWLQRSTQPADTGAIGAVLGTQAAGGFLAASGGKSWSEGLGEARENQADPMWRLKQAQMQGQILDRAAQAESQYALAKQRNQETSAWMQDAPTLSPWTSMTPEQRIATPPPQVSSKTAFGIVQKQSAADEQYLIRKTAADNQSVAAKISVRDASDFLKQVGTLKDRGAVADIKKMSSNPDGSPSKMQWDALGYAQQAEKQREENKIALFSGINSIAGLLANFQGTASAPPSTGTYAVGNFFLNSTPTAGGYMGWVCTTAGSPGVWKTFGAISA